MNKYLNAVFAVAIGSSCVLAQEDHDTTDAIRLRAMAIALSGQLDTLELRDDKCALGGLDLETTILGKHLDVPVRCFSYGISLPDESFHLLGSVDLPKAGRDFILVFIPSGEGYQCVPVRTDEPKFRGDDSILLNLSHYRIIATLGQTSTEIDPMSHVLMSPNHQPEENGYFARFSFEKDGVIHPFSQSKWPSNPNVKKLVLFFVDTESLRLQFRGVQILTKD